MRITLKRKLILWIVYPAVLSVLFFVFSAVWPGGPDYNGTFRPVTERFLQGETKLYDINGYGYFNAPWGILIIAPTLLFPPNYGQSILILGTLLGILFAVWSLNSSVFRKRHLIVAYAAIILSVSNLHTFDLLLRGNLDGLVIFGLGLSWFAVRRRKPILLGVGLCFLAIKPLNIILAVVVLLWSIRDWSRKEKIEAVVPATLLILISFLAIGFDWPIRYIQFVGNYPPYTFLQTSFWRATEYFGLEKGLVFWLAIPVILILVVTIFRSDIERKGELLLGFAIAANLVISPYTLGSHFVLLAPFFVMLVARNVWFILLWFLTFTPLVRLVYGFELAWIDSVYPLAVMIILFILLWRREKVSNDQVEWFTFEKSRGAN